MYDYTSNNWSHWNSNEKLKEKFGVRHPQHTQTCSNSSTIAADSSNGVTIPDAVDIGVCAPDDG
jgi:hypothetical protein